MVELLLAYGADPYAVDADRRTAGERLPAGPDERNGDRAAIRDLIAPGRAE